RHPLSRALAIFSGSKPMTAFSRIEEVPGSGIEAEFDGKVYRLGRRDWAGRNEAIDAQSSGPQTCLSIDGKIVETFHFEDRPREDAALALGELRQEGIKLGIMSGDKLPAVKKLAA